MKRNLLLDSASNEMPKTKNNAVNFLFFFLFMIYGSATVCAQGSVANDYSILQNIGPIYTDMVGGTSVPYTTLSLPAGNFGTTSFSAPAIPIGFNFAFNNALYSAVNISDNGYISFGANQAASTTPLSSALAYSGAISAYGFNLVGNVATPAIAPFTSTLVATAADGADIKYLLTGSPGSYVFTVEYKNMKRRGTPPTVTTTHDGLLNFQIRLYEVDMKIEIQYKSFSSQSANAINGQVGLRGLTNTDFNNRQGSWAATTAGLLNTATMTTSNLAGIGPAANAMFTWTPCFNPTALATNTISGTSAELIWTAPVFSTPGMVYNWEVYTPSGVPGSGGSVFSGTTLPGDNSVILTGLVSPPYTFYVKSSCKPNWTRGFLSGPVTLSCASAVFPYFEDFEGVISPARPFCSGAVATIGSLMRTRDSQSVTTFPGATPIGSYGGFGAPNKNLITADAANTDTYFFTRLVSLTAGTTYRVSYKYGGSREAAAFSQWLRVYLGNAETAAAMTTGTLLADHFNIKTTPNTFTFHFVAAATGNFYFGFRGVAGPINGYLQIDDISVNTPTCSPPTAVTTGAITFNSAVLSWTAPAVAPSAGYEYIIGGIATPNPISTTIISGATLGNVTTVTGLTPSTTYRVWVRSNCGGELSAWTTFITFATLAPPPVPCVPAPTSVDSSGITNVTVGSINNTTGAEPGRYGDYTSLVTNIAQSTTVNMILRFSIAGFVNGGYYTRIWIDFNDNGSFADAGETVFTNGGAELPNGINNISFTVPGAAPLGQHRMRIGAIDEDNTIMAGFGAGQGPCYNGAWGTFEDYSVLVTNPPPPLTLSGSSTSFCNGGTSPLITLNFNAHSGAPAVRYDNFVWNPVAGVSGTPTGGYTFSPTNAGQNVYTLTATQATAPFISNTVTYTVTVNDVPTPIVFTPATLAVCDGIPTALTSGGGIVTGALIFEETFNGPAAGIFGNIALPADQSDPTKWFALNTSTGGTNIPAAAWTIRTSPYVYSGRTFVSNDASQFCLSNSDAQGNGGGSTTNTLMTSPLMSFVGYTNVSLSYWQFYQGFPSGLADTEVWSDTNGNGVVDGGETTPTVVQSFSTASSGALSNFVNITIDLTAFAGQSNIRLRFKYYNATWAWFWAVDNVKITGSGPASLTWAPTAGLWLDAAATTTPYTGAPATTVYAKLNSNTSYTATAASLAPPFCSTSTVLNITVTKAGTATGNQVLACGDTTISSNITLTGYVPAVLGTIIGWQMADNPAFSLATVLPGSAGKAVLTPADISGLSTTTYFRAMILGCPTLFSNTITVSYPTSTWTGVWTPPGLPSVTDNVTVASGTLVIAADLSICSLKINNNATVTVNPGVTLTVNGNVVVAGGAPGGTLNMLDDNTFTLGAASLMQNPATTLNTNSGVARYERWIKTRKFDYTYWSSPLNPTTLVSVSPTTLSDKFLKFDSNAYVWTYPNPASTVMSPGVGYAIRGPQAYSETVLTNYKGNFIGTPNNGNITVALFRPSAVNDLNLLGNPYPSAIDADLVMDGNPGVMGLLGTGTTFYFWTHNTQYVGGSYLFSDYAAYNRTGGAGTAPGTFVVGGNNAPPNGFISAGQGFMVKATAAGNMTFRNNMRVAANNVQFFRPSASNAKSRIWLDYTNVNNVEEFKQLLVGYIPNATNSYEDGFDGEVIEAGSSIGFYSLAEQDNKHLMIQGRTAPFDSNDIVPLGYRATGASTYQIALSNQEGVFADDLVGIYLEDTLLGVVHDLRLAPYQFVTEAGTFDTRFVLRYNNGLLAVNPTDLNENNVVVFKKNEQIHIETSLVKMKSVKIFDMQGRLVIEKNEINSQSASLQKVGLANQVLMVQITSIDGVIVSKKIIF